MCNGRRTRGLGLRSDGTAALGSVVALVLISVTGTAAATPRLKRGTDTGLEVVAIGAAGSGTPVNSRSTDAANAGYTESEYFVSGDAQLYRGPSDGPAVATGQHASYTTRILVRVPQRADFSGRVVIEPFNTSAARDLDAAWGMVGPRLLTNGDAWIGITVRSSSVAALIGADSARYSSMRIASNGHAWDMLSQIAQLVRSRSERNPLHDFGVRFVYMTGYSQSAVDAVTYANAINPLTRRGGRFLYDGYLIMGRNASATPLDSGAATLPEFEIRPVGRAASPIVDVESQTDVEGFSDPAYTSPGSASVRRASGDARTDRYRPYEVPGAAHAALIPGCDHQGTTFPLEYFERAALTNLYRWAEDGTRPPRAPRIKMTSVGTVSVASQDADGNAVGGVRSPFLDHALARYAAHDTPGPLCALAGAEIPIDPTTLHARYPTVEDYMRRFTRSLDRAIARQVLLRSDRNRILVDVRAKAERALG